MHVHFSPDPRRRRSADALEVAEAARDAGHAGVVLKHHDYPSAAVAVLTEKVVQGVRVFGSICCDTEVGGINPAAVESALRIGAKVVWLPTHSSAIVNPGSAAESPHQGGTISALADDGKLSLATREVLDLVEQHNAVVATGHTSVAEHYAVVREFASRGAVIVTHAREAHCQPDLDIDQCVELADLGATIELAAMTCVGAWPCRSVHEMAATVRAVGPDRCVLATDFGQRANPSPVAGLQLFADGLLEEGIAEVDIRTMACAKPAHLLGVPTTDVEPV